MRFLRAQSFNYWCDVSSYHWAYNTKTRHFCIYGDSYGCDAFCNKWLLSRKEALNWKETIKPILEKYNLSIKE